MLVGGSAEDTRRRPCAGYDEDMLPPPPSPSRSQTMFKSCSPFHLQKESGGATHWWSAAKSRLMPMRNPPMHAQQIILDAKARDNKNAKGKKEKKKQCLATAQGKFTDPAFVSLHIPTIPIRRVPVPSSSPSSLTPSRPEYATQLDAFSHAYKRYFVFLPFSRGSTLVRAVHISRNARCTKHTPHDSQTL